MSTNKEHKVSCKVWLELCGEPLIGKGGAKILETIKDVESISKAAKETGMSYRYIWNYLSKLERRLGEPVVKTFKGGTKGGGGAKLTELGVKLLNEYKQAEINMALNMNSQTFVAVEGSEYCLTGKVQEMTPKNDLVNIKIGTKNPTNLSINVPKKTVDALSLQNSDMITVTINANKVKITKENTINS